MRPRLLVVFAALLGTAACANDVAAPVAARARGVVDPNASHAVWAQSATGTTGPGADYAMYVPERWNGALVIYTHGYVNPALPVTLPSIDGLRDALGANGFAVAYSSYATNGFAVKDGAQRTHQLKGLFAAKFGNPRRTYLMGHSLGGAIAMSLAESYPSQYDGALPMCGFVGGSTAEINYVANVRVLFDAFYPGVLPGDAMHVPDGLTLDATTIGALATAIGSNPTGAVVIAQTTQTAVPIGSHLEDLGASIINALGFQIMGTRDMLERTHGHIPFDNSATVYSSPNSTLADALSYANSVADRFTGEPAGQNFLQHYFEPTGNIRIPTITLHTSRDPVVPVWHEPMYAAKAADAGRSTNLVQRTVDRFGHCTFTGTEMLTAFGQLVAWVELGVVPSP